MSLRKTIRSEIITELTSKISTVTVRSWDGDIEHFNELKEWPCIQVAYSGLMSSDNMEVAPSVNTWGRRLFYTVFVNALTTDILTGDESCMDILESIEEALMVYSSTNVKCGFSMAGPEEIVKAHAGYFLYAQPWETDVIKEV